MEAKSDWQIGKSLSDRMKYMLDNQLMCDVTFHVGIDKTPIKAHKYMLASSSPVFYSMFEGPLAEKGTVEIADMKPEYFNMILLFLYTDKITVDSNNIRSLLYGSEKYMLQLLKDECDAFLASNVDIDHACVVLQIAHDFNMEDLKTKALHFIFENGSRILDSKDFLNLSAECLTLLLNSDKFRCEEEHIYQQMVQWGQHKCKDKSLPATDENVRECLGDLLYLIRFPVMKPKYFTEEISCKSVLTATEIVKVFQHFNDKTTDIFPSKKRISKIKIERCQLNKKSSWTCSGLDDCIDFKTSFNAKLSVVLLFGSTTYSGTDNVKINIARNSVILSTTQTVLTSSAGHEIYKIKLNPPVHVLANNQYTIQVNITGQSTFKGKEYIRNVTTEEGFSVNFLPSSLPSTNSTSISNGQIQGLFFDL
ncbi:BTB/POZ domain-containing protein 2-like [Mytilus californianus]|uniref:BTB/POZ domain-containing protein 2-like n=1 Tax=Mytilus californianus TaxID=6549 RepID=UPI00224680C0|nr:BTB/POZ domain-containing protein 2-like [Mytilus californianus]XP_052077380.1 BTB/POZ domain-containing protein 2-like [Mytilus californianus]XP_052077381.1 BTB/POZ domain-containing protein 2-like [Mytilus californianus]XP_052077382.1 BTB/POZ domain-containing protein 2-like [Mytilus californianus]